MATKVAKQILQNLHICNQNIVFNIPIKISFLDYKVHVSEILRHFSLLYPTHSRLVYDPTGTILPILYSKVPHMLHAKYQPNWNSGSGEESFEPFLPYMGMAAILTFRKIIFFS